MPFNFRPATPADAEQIFRLYEIEKWIFFTRNKIEKLISAPNSNYFVIEKDNEIAAFARYITDDVMTTFLAEIIVAAPYRRQGLGKCLIENIHSRHPETRIELISDVDDFYKAVGFEYVGGGFRRSN